MTLRLVSPPPHENISCNMLQISPEPLVLVDLPKCTLGCPILDALLHGGIPIGSITELVGESTAGKTQIALQLLLTAQLPVERGGLGGRSLYIHTESAAPLERLRQIGRRFSANDAEMEDLCEGILVRKAVEGPGQLWQVLQQAEALVASGSLTPPLRLIVVDSVANPFRELDASHFGELSERCAALYHIACLLKQLAHRHRLAVLLTNHVVDLPDPRAHNPAPFPAHAPAHPSAHTPHNSGLPIGLQACGGRALSASGRKVLPALGLHWAHCVNTRLHASRQRASAEEGGQRRRLEVVFAPHLPPGSVRYRVGTDGVWGEEELEGEEQRRPQPQVQQGASVAGYHDSFSLQGDGIGELRDRYHEARAAGGGAGAAAGEAGRGGNTDGARSRALGQRSTRQ